MIEKCQRCGECCEKGGPALHIQDIDLIRKKIILPNHLITIRKNELAYDPVRDSVEPVKAEFLKIGGTHGKWTCRFYDKTRHGCLIYENRPLACRVLKCWDTADILTLSGKDLLSRFDLVEKDSVMAEKIKEYDSLYPCPDMQMISRKGPRSSKKVVRHFEEMITNDLSYRFNAVKAHNLSISEEMFYFGRPLFQLFQALGFGVSETSRGIKLSFKKRKDNP
ncbi:MAG: YkgJ family cysteine cluster protein [Desulfobacteraceae bacterium]